ncbi:MAG: hypothetical protein NT069_05370 [Planctomycetota bacterium]|nr:hypothetical protein [Planctomycetota bacterium]
MIELIKYIDHGPGTWIALDRETGCRGWCCCGEGATDARLQFDARIWHHDSQQSMHVDCDHTLCPDVDFAICDYWPFEFHDCGIVVTRAWIESILVQGQRSGSTDWSWPTRSVPAMQQRIGRGITIDYVPRTMRLYIPRFGAAHSVAAGSPWCVEFSMIGILDIAPTFPPIAYEAMASRRWLERKARGYLKPHPDFGWGFFPRNI